MTPPGRGVVTDWFSIVIALKKVQIDPTPGVSNRMAQCRNRVGLVFWNQILFVKLFFKNNHRKFCLRRIFLRDFLRNDVSVREGWVPVWVLPKLSVAFGDKMPFGAGGVYFHPGALFFF